VIWASLGRPVPTGEMAAQRVLEEHPTGEHVSWVSNIVIAPKDDGGLRVLRILIKRYIPQIFQFRDMKI